MWVFRGHSKFLGSLRLYVLDVGFQRVQSIFLFLDVGCVRCGFSEGTERSRLPEVECVICEISEGTVSFLVP